MMNEGLKSLYDAMMHNACARGDMLQVKEIIDSNFDFMPNFEFYVRITSSSHVLNVLFKHAHIVNIKQYCEVLHCATKYGCPREVFSKLLKINVATLETEVMYDSGGGEMVQFDILHYLGECASA